MTASLPHSALITLTGWAAPAERGVLVGGLPVRTSWRPESPTRVTVTVYPRTRPDGSLRDLFAQPHQFRPAHDPNGAHVVLTGQLLRVDRTEGRVLRVGPGLLLAETVMPVHAPVPECWNRWRPRRSRHVDGSAKAVDE